VEETWATALERLALILGGGSEQFRVEAESWLREAVACSWRRESLHDLTRSERQVAFQRLLGVAYDLAGEGEIAFALDHRDLVARAFRRHFCLENWQPVGPPWRLAPTETTLPTWDELCEFENFGAAGGGGS
jgi:hypothetical protein